MPVFCYDDFASIADNRETYTLSRRDGSTASMDNCLRRALGTREAAASNGKYTTSDVRIHVDPEAVDPDPIIGDVITDGDGTRWTVLETSLETLGTRRACICRALAIVNGLTQRVKIEEMTVTKGDVGQPVSTWTEVKSVAAKIQPEASYPTMGDKQARSNRLTYSAWFEEDVQLTSNRRVVDYEGNDYTVDSYTVPEDLGKLPEARLSRDPWPL